MDSAGKRSRGLLRKVGGTFLAGLLAALPLALTLAAIFWFAELVKRFLGPDSALGGMLGSIGLKFVIAEVPAYLVGVAITLAIIYLFGLLVETGMKSHWQALVDNILNRVPLVRTLYKALDKLVKMFDLEDQTELKSMSPVMCYFGGKDGGTAVLALLTSPEPVNLNDRDYYAIMIPTAPVPFGGAIMYLPVEWVESADLELDGLLDIYMSMGVTSAGHFNKPPEHPPEDNDETVPDKPSPS
jgi:uncharacterized membrane protein